MQRVQTVYKAFSETPTTNERLLEIRKKMKESFSATRKPSITKDTRVSRNLARVTTLNEKRKDRDTAKHDRDESPGEGQPRKSTINKLVGPGVSSCALNLPHFELRGVDISATLMLMREEKIKEQLTLTLVDELLTLNFIFSRKFLEGGKGKGLTDEIINDIYGVEILPSSSVIRTFLSTCSKLGELRYEDFSLEFSRMVGDLDPETMKVGTELYMAKQMVTNWTRTEALWMECERNEATYLDVYISPILDAVFSGAGLITHKKEFLPLPEVYMTSKGFRREDFKPDSQYRENGFPIVVMDAKRPFTANHLTLKDEFKLCNMMKLSLDLMIDNSVEIPTVVGILVQRDQVEIFIMDLPHEAFYPVKSLGTIKVPKTPQEFDIICDGQGILLTAK
ncbi:hypothetical protein BGX31_002073, partial [Mortierella sp. GBA43]